MSINRVGRPVSSALPGPPVTQGGDAADAAPAHQPGAAGSAAPGPACAHGRPQQRASAATAAPRGALAQLAATPLQQAAGGSPGPAQSVAARLRRAVESGQLELLGRYTAASLGAAAAAAARGWMALGQDRSSRR
jgi:hypothetical protein